MYPWVVKFLEKVLVFSLKQDLAYFHQGHAEEWLFFDIFNKKRKIFEAENNSELHKNKLLKYHEAFPIFLGESVNRNIIIMISKGYHYMINLGIVSNFLSVYALSIL